MPIYFLPTAMTRMTRWYISIVKVNGTKEVKKRDETRNYLLDEIKHNDLMIENHKKVSKTLNYFEIFFAFVYAVSGCVLISAFASLH